MPYTILYVADNHLEKLTSKSTRDKAIAAAQAANYNPKATDPEDFAYDINTQRVYLLTPNGNLHELALIGTTFKIRD